MFYIFNAVLKGYKQAKVKWNRTILEMKVVLLNSVCSLNMDKCNQENIVCAGLGIYTLKDIFKAVQKGYEQVRVKQNQIILGSKVILPDSVCSLDINRRN